MSAPMGDAEDTDWRAGLAALQRLHARLSTTAEAWRVALARPGARGDGAVTGLAWEIDALPEAERVALYASVCADLQTLEALTEPLAQLSARLEAHDPPRPPQ